MQSSFTSTDTFICRLSTLGIISIIGEDATSYLQGKVTNNVEQLTPQQAQLGCHCDFKGKSWNVFHALGEKQHIDLLCHVQAIPVSLAEFKKYGVFSKAEFTDTTTNYQFIGISGEAPQQALEQLFGDLPQHDLNVVENEKGRVIRFDQPNEMCVLSSTSGVDGTGQIELVALSRNRTRMRVELDVKPKTLPARLLMQSARLARNTLNRRYKTRVANFAEDMEDRYVRGLRA